MGIARCSHDQKKPKHNVKGVAMNECCPNCGGKVYKRFNGDKTVIACSLCVRKAFGEETENVIKAFYEV